MKPRHPMVILTNVKELCIVLVIVDTTAAPALYIVSQ